MWWMRWRCPPDTGFEIRVLAVWGRARYHSVTEAPHNFEFHTWMGKKHFVSFKPPRSGTEPRTLGWKAAVLTTTLGPPPSCWTESMCSTNFVKAVRLPILKNALVLSHPVNAWAAGRHALTPLLSSPAIVWMGLYCSRVTVSKRDQHACRLHQPEAFCHSNKTEARGRLYHHSGRWP